ncbi:MAG: hypothetical protein AAF357_11040 [Verrucomicrobiota bacterium]
MSENLPEPDLPESDQELEALLSNLQPNPVEFELLRGLEDDCEAVLEMAEAKPGEPHLKWQRLIPLTLIGALGMLAYVSFHYGPELNSRSGALTAESAVNVQPPAMVSSLESGQFQPVSAQGFLVNSSSAGLVETEEGPHEKMSLEYQDAYHWHNPETGTNIRYFQPRSKEVIVPLQTD